MARTSIVSWLRCSPPAPPSLLSVLSPALQLEVSQLKRKFSAMAFDSKQQRPVVALGATTTTHSNTKQQPQQQQQPAMCEVPRAREGSGKGGRGG
jgi:hypothetical protein